MLWQYDLSCCIHDILVQFSLSNNKQCYCCNGKAHNTQNCKFKEAVCHGCNKKGHIVKACRASSKPHFKKKTRRVNFDSLNKRFCMCTFRSPQTILSLNASFKNALNSQYLESFLRKQKSVVFVASRCVINFRKIGVHIRKPVDHLVTTSARRTCRTFSES
jgi:hypothetical protein